MCKYSRDPRDRGRRAKNSLMSRLTFGERKQNTHFAPQIARGNTIITLNNNGRFFTVYGPPSM